MFRGKGDCLQDEIRLLLQDSQLQNYKIPREYKLRVIQLWSVGPKTLITFPPI